MHRTPCVWLREPLVASVRSSAAQGEAAYGERSPPAEVEDVVGRGRRNSALSEQKRDLSPVMRAMVYHMAKYFSEGRLKSGALRVLVSDEPVEIIVSKLVEQTFPAAGRLLGTPGAVLQAGLYPEVLIGVVRAFDTAVPHVLRPEQVHEQVGGPRGDGSSSLHRIEQPPNGPLIVLEERPEIAGGTRVRH